MNDLSGLLGGSASAGHPCWWCCCWRWCSRWSLPMPVAAGHPRRR
ncbi:hypothetical protein ACPA9J_08120 [Pseudomonas aeruginosa]